MGTFTSLREGDEHIYEALAAGINMGGPFGAFCEQIYDLIEKRESEILQLQEEIGELERAAEDDGRDG